MGVSRKRSVWHKGLAAFLLLWALADLSVPGLCKSDNDRSPDAQPIVASVKASQAGSQDVVRKAVPGSGQQGTSTFDEDCFCCCSHIVPSAHFQLPAITASVPGLTVYHFEQVTASAPALYHPPRS